MKKLACFIIFTGLSLMCLCSSMAQPKLEGAWQGVMDTRTHQKVEIQAIIENHYLAIAYFSAEDGSFIRTLGGKMNYKGDDMSIDVEFDSQHPEKVGTTIHFFYHAKSNKIRFTNSKEIWKRVDFGNESNLTGAWQITARKKDGELTKRKLSPRKTVKILSGTRFQWIAFDTSNGQFRGTGGGTYATDGDNYIEKLMFFSRDHTRVGQSLNFNYEVIQGDWHHSGTSTKGEPIYEVWSLNK